ncbi:MAG: cob(I)yrinic acid a,c-diamide adenosyltransferase [Bacteroidetes bacterium]|nr:MAG: cob(I)yrinic acid a,c-diamide adenosyltransferase [Bacteroidota bacterium]
MKIYTKKGDEGQTSLIGGTRVSKSHLRIETYGTVDELNSWVGYMRDHHGVKKHTDFLMQIQDRLFTIGSHLAADPEKSKMKLPEITEQDITTLENQMDIMDKSLPEMRSFVLPGGHEAVSRCHITRCVCRRAERLVVSLSEQESAEAIIIKYLNRLSDYFFVLSRYLANELNATERPWEARF